MSTTHGTVLVLTHFRMITARATTRPRCMRRKRSIRCGCGGGNSGTGAIMHHRRTQVQQQQQHQQCPHHIRPLRMSISVFTMFVLESFLLVQAIVVMVLVTVIPVVAAQQEGAQLHQQATSFATSWQRTCPIPIPFKATSVSLLPAAEKFPTEWLQLSDEEQGIDTSQWQNVSPTNTRVYIVGSTKGLVPTLNYLTYVLNDGNEFDPPIAFRYLSANLYYQKTANRTEASNIGYGTFCGHSMCVRVCVRPD